MVAVRGCFVTGTDTGAGKTILAAALCAAIRAAGDRAAAFKPVVTGLEQSPGAWPADHELLAAVTGSQPRDVTTRTFQPAVSPHLAAELAGATISLAELLASAATAARDADILVVEGVGGLLVPLNAEHDVRDLAVALGLPVVIAARPGLGTINHSLLTIQAARAAGLDVRAAVLTPWPDEPTTMERSNRDTIARRGRVEVATLRSVRGIGDLAGAGATLPWPRWVGGGSIDRRMARSDGYTGPRRG